MISDIPLQAWIEGILMALIIIACIFYGVHQGWLK